MQLILAVLVVLLATVGAQYRYQEQYRRRTPNPRDKWCRLNLGPLWGGRC